MITFLVLTHMLDATQHMGGRVGGMLSSGGTWAKADVPPPFSDMSTPSSALQIISFRGSRPALLCLAGHAQEPTGLPALYNRVSHLCAFAMSFIAGTYLFHGMGLHASSASRSRTPAATMFVSLLPSGCTAVWFFLFRFFARLFQERRQEGFSCR